MSEVVPPSVGMNIRQTRGQPPTLQHDLDAIGSQPPHATISKPQLRQSGTLVLGPSPQVPTQRPAGLGSKPHPPILAALPVITNSNRSDLPEQLRNVAVILSDVSQDDGAGTKVTPECVIRLRLLRDRFSPDDLQVMIDLYTLGATAKQVTEKFGISLRSVKRLLHQHGVRRERPARHL
jgi:hypothetical protein